MDDGAEIVLDQHDRAGFAGDVGSATAHGDADVRGLERGRIVHPVARHGDDFTVGLQGLDDPHLLLRLNAREYLHGPDPPASAASSSRANPGRS